MSSPRSIRWWPLVLLLVGLAAGYLWFGWLNEVEQRQDRALPCLALSLLGIAGVAVWWIVLSRTSAIVRVGGLVAVGIVGTTCSVMFEYEGLDGDFVPQFTRRFREVAEVRPDGRATQAIGAHPQFLGTSRDGIVEPFGLEADWEAHPPQLIWRRAVGKGWSGFAIRAPYAVTQELHEDGERVTCIDLLTSELRWTVEAEDAIYTNGIAGDGPRATPTLDGEDVVTVGGTGLLQCIDITKGTPRWSVELSADGPLPEWGYSASPLLVDDQVVVAGLASTLVSYDRATGRERWRAGDDSGGYASPLKTALHGVDQLIAFNRASVTGHALNDGRVLWSVDWQGRNPNTAQPLPLDSTSVMISSGYGAGAARIDLTRTADGAFEAEVSWRRAHLKSKFANFFEHDGSVYGLDDGTMVCINPVDGRRRWKDGDYGHGQLLRVGDVALVTAESGEVALVRLDDARWDEVGRFTATSGITWNHAALAAPYLLVRNAREAALWRLPTRDD